MDRTETQGRLFQEPRLKSRACSGDLLPSGTYAALPLAILKRRDIPPTTLKVYIALLSKLRGGNVWITPSIREIMQITGLGDRSIRRGIRWMEERGFIECRRRRGLRNMISFAPPDDWPDQDERALAEVFTSRQEPTTPHETDQGTPAKTAGVPRPKPPGYPGQNRRGTRHKSSVDNAPNGLALTTTNNLLQTTATDVVVSHDVVNSETLQRIGLNGDCVHALAGIPGLTPLHIAMIAIRAGPKVRNLAGWLRARLESGPVELAPPKAREVWMAWKRGWIPQLNGWDLRSPEIRCGWDPHYGLNIFREVNLIGRISMARLRELT